MSEILNQPENNVSITANGHEIQNTREQLELSELGSMLEDYEINGSTPAQRVESLKQLPKEAIAIFLTDLNARLNGSSESLVSEKTVTIGDRSTIEPSKRYELFDEIIGKIKNNSDLVAPERIGDTLALSTVLLHPFKDGNGRTARMLGYIFRDSLDGEDAHEDFSTLVESRDAARERGGFLINGYVPYMGEGVDQSDPAEISKYIDRLLSESESGLYTSPFGEATLPKRQPESV